jgi:RNA polymerase sigma-70 factor (ECF subfamily)
MGAEADLVGRLRRGDREAFLEVYQTYRERLFGFLLRLTKRRDLAEDLLQETWLRLARSAHKLAPETALAPWLYTVARNAHTSYRRWSMLDLSRLVALRRESDVLAAIDLDRRTDAAKALVKVERALAQLSVADRELLLLVGVEGFEPDAAAAILGVTAVAFRQRLSRARARLDRRIEEADPTALSAEPARSSR